MSDKAKIIIFDDDLCMLKALQMVLGSKYIVRTCTDSKSVLELIESEGADLILSDMEMPQIDGIQLLSQVKRNYPALPVIIFSGCPVDIEERCRLAKTTADAFFPKPFNNRQLIDKMDQLLAQRSRPSYHDLPPEQPLQ